MVQVRKEDYIYQIKIALKGKIPAERVKYYAKYYEDYITEQVRQGKKTDEVIEVLGDPNLIAKTIITTEQMGKNPDYRYDAEDERIKKEKRTLDRMKLEKIIGIVTLVVVLLLVLSIILKIVTVILKLLLPVILILIVVAIVKNILKPKS